MNHVEMVVSPICVKNQEKFAYVMFTDGSKSAEGKIPDCVILHNQGFGKEEIMQLENYMKREIVLLKKMAAGTNVVRALMK